LSPGFGIEDESSACGAAGYAARTALLIAEFGIDGVEEVIRRRALVVDAHMVGVTPERLSEGIVANWHPEADE
jgi:hypothetical protein